MASLDEKTMDDKLKMGAILSAVPNLIKTIADLDFDKEFIKENLQKICNKMYDLSKERNGSIPIHFRNSHGALAMMEMIGDTKHIHAIFKNKKEMFGKVMIVKEKEDEFRKEFDVWRKYIKKNPNDIVFGYHNSLQEYMVNNIDELLIVLSQNEFTLYDCHIRTFKMNGVKYKRINFQPKDKEPCGISVIEFVFSNMVDGITYILSKDDWEKHKTAIYDKVTILETEYGKDTRHNICGQIYKKGKDDDQ